MSVPLLVADPAVAGDFSVPTKLPASEASAKISSDVAEHLVSGTSTLGAAVLIERGAGFLANILAARFGGAAVFGAYSLGISTANNISTYAAGGIGATATRYSGKYSYHGGSYSTFARVLTVVALISASVAAAVLWLGAAPIAALLQKTTLTQLLRWASISAAGMILLECARGFFVGQRRLVALALLSVLVGVGMVSLLPAIAATHRPIGMLAAQGGVTLTAVVVCLALARPLGLVAPATQDVSVRFASMLREVWGFGFIQLSGLLSANLAGWWLTALVARGDTTLVQMGFFAIASQFRNLTGIIPGLLTESSYAVMASSSEDAGMPDHVMALCTFACTSVSFLVASAGIVVAPWALRLLYGQHYATAGVAAAVGMSVAVVQMGNSPPSARMSIVSIRWVAIVNTIWAVFVAVAGTLLLFRSGSAAEAMAVFFAGHVLLASVVLLILYKHDHLPEGMISLFLLSTCSVLSLSLLCLFRDRRPSLMLLTTALMALIVAASAASMYWLGKRHGWLPGLASMRCLALAMPRRLRCLVSFRGSRISRED